MFDHFVGLVQVKVFLKINVFIKVSLAVKITHRFWAYSKGKCILVFDVFIRKGYFGVILFNLVNFPRSYFKDGVGWTAAFISLNFVLFMSFLGIGISC